MAVLTLGRRTRLLCLAAAALLGRSGWAGAAAVATESAPAVVRPAQIVQRCLTLRPAELLALQRGEARVVVALKAFDPGRPPATGLTVHLVPPGDAAHPNPKHLEVARLGVHPLRAFSASSWRRGQRFAVPVDEHASLLVAGRALCLVVGFDAAVSPASGARALLRLEWARLDEGAAR